MFATQETISQYVEFVRPKSNSGRGVNTLRPVAVAYETDDYDTETQSDCDETGNN